MCYLITFLLCRYRGMCMWCFDVLGPLWKREYLKKHTHTHTPMFPCYPRNIRTQRCIWKTTRKLPVECPSTIQLKCLLNTKYRLSSAFNTLRSGCEWSGNIERLNEKSTHTCVCAHSSSFQLSLKPMSSIRIIFYDRYVHLKK